MLHWRDFTLKAYCSEPVYYWSVTEQIQPNVHFIHHMKWMTQPGRDQIFKNKWVAVLIYFNKRYLKAVLYQSSKPSAVLCNGKVAGIKHLNTAASALTFSKWSAHSLRGDHFDCLPPASLAVKGLRVENVTPAGEHKGRHAKHVHSAVYAQLWIRQLY